MATDPLTLEVDSRRIGDESRIVLLHVGERACVESPDVDVTFQKGSFKLCGLSIGPLQEVDPARRHFAWSPACVPSLTLGDELVIADFAWFSDLKGNHQLPIERPTADTTSSPRADCTPDSYGEDPDGHRWCCWPEVSEAEWSDTLAERRSRGELNPQAWPPVVDTDAFEVSPTGAAVGDSTATPSVPPPDDVTADDLD